MMKNKILQKKNISQRSKIKIIRSEISISYRITTKLQNDMQNKFKVKT